MANLEALKKLQDLLNEDAAFVWVNKALKRIELSRDIETFEIAKTLTKNCNIIAELESKNNAEIFKDLKIVEVKSFGNILGKCTHKVLNMRLNTKTWEKVKHCFKFTNTKEINDEHFIDSFVGYEIVNEIELRRLLNF